MTPIRPRRSVLYMPGSNARALEKAKTLAADALILDLEDAVAPEAKEQAREQVCEAVRAGGYGGREVVIRVNALASPWGEADLAAAAAAGAGAVCAPKVGSAEDVTALREALEKTGAPAETALWAMIETPAGVLNIAEIAAAVGDAQHPLAVLVLGTNDLAKETRVEAGAERTPLLSWLSQCVLAARAHGLDVLDGVYNDLNDMQGFARECAQGRRLGMDGKTLIHPGQIDAANAAFSPGAAEIEWARKIIAAFEAPENRGKAVIPLEGRMVELLHRDAAARTVAIAEAIDGAAPA